MVWTPNPEIWTSNLGVWTSDLVVWTSGWSQLGLIYRESGVWDPDLDPGSRDQTPKYDHLDPKLDHSISTLYMILRIVEIE